MRNGKTTLLKYNMYFVIMEEKKVWRGTINIPPAVAFGEKEENDNRSHVKNITSSGRSNM